MRRLPTVDQEAILEEQRRADALRRTVDVACAFLRHARLPRAEAEAVVALARERALEFCVPPRARLPQ